MHFRTRAIHVGQHPDPATGSVIPPIHLASTFIQKGIGIPAEYDYARTGTPTRHNLEQTLASLDDGIRALAFSSGMAAIHCVSQLLTPGDHIVTGTDLYGGSWRLFHKVLAKQGITVTAVPTSDFDRVCDAFTDCTKLLWLESPGNPLLSITDFDACVKYAHARGALVACDNTLATPVLSRPLSSGADIVMHSATKYLGGHSDLLGGVLVMRDPQLAQTLAWHQNATGAVMGPLECFLCSRGLKTLQLRVLEQSRTALEIARFLRTHPRVEIVYYPGLEEHPGHLLATKQMQGGYGAIVSFEVNGDPLAARKIVTLTKIFHLAVSLGAVESLIELPANMSHGAYEASARLACGIVDGLVRLSVGLEAFEDLRDDLDQALAHPDAV